MEEFIKAEKQVIEEERARFIRDLGMEIAKKLREKTPIISYIG